MSRYLTPQPPIHEMERGSKTVLLPLLCCASLLPFIACIWSTNLQVTVKKFDPKDAEVVNPPGDVHLLSSNTDLMYYCKGREVLKAQFIEDAVVRVWCAR
ncbi:MAG: hypothetical protein KF713_00045 [Turneriella sp.]|nr:hypothetical protein [Turneriella sp.]